MCNLVVMSRHHYLLPPPRTWRMLTSRTYSAQVTSGPTVSRLDALKLNGIFLGTTKKRATKREVKDTFEALSDSEKQKWPALCKEKLHKRRKYEMLWPWGSEWAKWLEGGMARRTKFSRPIVIFMERVALLSSITSLERRKRELQLEIDAVNSELNVQNAGYARFVNDDALIYRLPNEILAGIFLTCQRIARNSNKAVAPFQITASHVSHRWREIVLSTPLLWNVIDFRVRPLNHFQGRVFSQLEAHLLHSDRCFLDITLDFLLIENLSAYLKLLSAHSTRWRRLSIVTIYQQVDDIYSLLREVQTPILEHLSLSLGRADDGPGSLSPRKPYLNVSPTIFPSGAPSLSFVRLAGHALGNLHPPTSSITTLHLDGWTRHYITHNQLKDIFEAATSLVNLSLNQLVIHHPRDPLEVLQPVNLPNLRSLRIRGPCSPASRFLSLMETPQLHSLSLHGIETFDSGILQSVQHLTIDSCAMDELHIGHLFRSFPSISFVSVDESLPDIFSMLLPDPAVPTPWPHLRTVSLRDLQSVDVPYFCNLVFTLQKTEKGLSNIFLDRRSRTVLRTRHRLDWLQERVKVEHCDTSEPWPFGLGYEDAHDLLE
ncbi:hypothetical protein BDZ97DRAFT_1755504 [Flammula alnicola]|nr:hypothetical protein BDZ97DRAFT_1755504 [Flammula alnicola]